MPFEIRTEACRAGDRTGEKFIIAGPDCEAEVWPSHGFNCLRWSVKQGDLLFQSPEWETNPVPTRSGVPILFPFPNRLRQGVFTWNGRTLHLPTTEASGGHAIHGSAPRYPWRVVGQYADEAGGTLVGEFRPSVDAPEVLEDWPCDYTLRVTISLRQDSLELVFVATNEGEESMPAGFGLHPYFALPGVPSVDDFRLTVPADCIWELREGLPTGRRVEPSDEFDFALGNKVGSTQLDTLYTELGHVEGIDDDDLLTRAKISGPGGSILVRTSREFREIMLFTPPHRKALAVEPYTCATDAVHLAQAEIDAGLAIVEPGETFSGTARFVWEGRE